MKMPTAFFFCALAFVLIVTSAVHLRGTDYGDGVGNGKAQNSKALAHDAKALAAPPPAGQPIEDGEGVGSRGAAGISSVYGADSHFLLLQRIAALEPEFALDAYDLMEWAYNLCSVEGRGLKAPAGSYVESYRGMVARGVTLEHPEIEASYAYLDKVKARYCNAGTLNETPQEARQYTKMLERRRASGSQSPEYARLLELEADLAAGNEEAVSAVVDVAISARSPALFKEGVDMLVAVGWSPPGYRAPGFAHEQQQLAIAELGGQLAYCTLSVNACASGSLLSHRFCLPSNCVPGESVQQFLTRNATPDEIRAAQAYANALLAMRRRR